VLAFGRDLIDKCLGDRLAEKQGSKQREVIENGALLRGGNLARSATVRRVSVASGAAGAFLVMAISLSGVTVSSRKWPSRPGWLNRP
jgi:hypothetical protein